MRSRSFTRKGDAQTFDREIKRRLQLGPHLTRELARNVLTLDDFVRSGFRSYAATLAPKTRDIYAWALEHHLRELVDEPLVALDVPRLAEHQQLLLARGRTPSTVREVMARLSGILQVAVEHGKIPANPARGLRKVAAATSDEPRPLAPVELERLIMGFSGRDRAIALLGGHFGLRPMEIRLVPWGSLADGKLTIGRARTKKSAARTRVLAVPAVTETELKRWRMESGRPRDDAPIIGEWSAASLARWGRQVFAPAVKEIAGRDDVSLYTLRHTHASALHYASWTVPAAARRLGHGPALHVRTYAHVIDALEGRERFADLDALIAAARAECRDGAASVSESLG